jgi:ATP-dependent RNA helicase DDX42
MSVVNFDPAKNLDSHIHRVGRAGRLRSDAGESEQYSTGVAYTLLTSKNAEFASVLVDAFEREGREVSDDLMKLATQSMRIRGGRSGKQKTGIGFNS